MQVTTGDYRYVCVRVCVHVYTGTGTGMCVCVCSLSPLILSPLSQYLYLAFDARQCFSFGGHQQS